MIVVAQQHHLNDQMGIKNRKIIIGFLNLTLRISPAGTDCHFRRWISANIFLVRLTAEIGKLEMM
jgi:hypothetical protein